MLDTLCVTSFLEEQNHFELIIDTRSPAEFAHSHIPGAINLWALDDAQHKEVGTHYKQLSKNEAKIMGASYICENAAKHLKTLASLRKIGAKIAVYCARGGLRSTALGLIFSGVGYRVCKLEGGYKAFRGAVKTYLDSPQKHRFVVLGGNTGCGKSELIAELDNAIDLEGLANHLGSAFGAIRGAQPSQKAFEDMLFFTLKGADASKPVFIESESRKIGACMLPVALRQGMDSGIRVEITAPLDQRIARIVRDYEGVDSASFYGAMQKITPYIKKSAKEATIEAFERGDLSKVAEVLLLDYYDKVYKKPEKVDVEIENSDHSKTLQILREIALKH